MVSQAATTLPRDLMVLRLLTLDMPNEVRLRLERLMIVSKPIA